jgi:hypothetical protein
LDESLLDWMMVGQAKLGNELLLLLSSIILAASHCSDAFNFFQFVGPCNWADCRIAGFQILVIHISHQLLQILFTWKRNF